MIENWAILYLMNSESVFVKLAFVWEWKTSPQMRRENVIVENVIFEKLLRYKHQNCFYTGENLHTLERLV